MNKRKKKEEIYSNLLNKKKNKLNKYTRKENKSHMKHLYRMHLRFKFHSVYICQMHSWVISALFVLLKLFFISIVRSKC